MRRSAAASCLPVVLALALAVPRAGKTAEFELAGHKFTLPAGLELQLAASAPLVERPIVADFDGLGRLYVAEASGTNDPVAKQAIDKPHRIVRLTDDDGDGAFDHRTVFADKLMLPQGLMWLDGSLYVGAPPSIWKLTDTDDDGVADQRQEWFDGKTLTGCANDLHGPFRGPDGWIYWCKGGFAEQTYERPGRPPLVTRAAHIFRARPDGTGIEPVMTGGMDNPVELVFTYTGERIFSTTFFQHPGGGQRDGLIHAVYGGLYGKVHDVLDGHVHTGPNVLPVLTQLGPAAPAGLVRYEAEVLGEGFRDNLFAALFNLHKVTRHVLQADGATFRTVDSDFLVAEDRDFHPTDVVEDADGSLLVIDTGGWYKLCCPTSQLVKPDLTGGIYRVRSDQHKFLTPVDPWGKKFDWSGMRSTELLAQLHSPRTAVARSAADELVRRGHAGVEEINSIEHFAFSFKQSIDEIRVLTRIDDPLARELVAKRISGNTESIRHAAMLSAGLWRDAKAVPELVERLADDTDYNRRAAAEALGRIGDPSAVPALLKALKQVNDPILEHSLIYALIEIGDPAAVTLGLKAADVRARRGALIALDQMPGERLTSAQLREFLSTTDVELSDTATWIAGRHPEWGQALADYFRQRLEAEDVYGVQFVALEQQLANFAGTPAIAQLLADRLGDVTASDELRQFLLQTMTRTRLKTAPSEWISPLRRALASRNEAVAAAAVQAAGVLHFEADQAARLSEPLVKLAHDTRHDLDARLAALAAVPGGLAEVDDEIFLLLRAQLDGQNSAPRRAAAAGVLAGATLSAEQLGALAADLRNIGPLEIEKLIAAFCQSHDPQVGQQLVDALSQAPALASLRVEVLKPVLENFGPQLKEPAEKLYAALAADADAQRGAIDALVKATKDGDARRGQAIFNGAKAACAACHTIGYVGGKLGPDLTRIGQIRGERDLLEAIVFPSASLVRSYEPVTIETAQGKIYSGLVRSESVAAVTLATSASDQIVIPRADIEQMRPGKVSLMPAGLDKQLTQQELADLLAFLKACR